MRAVKDRLKAIAYSAFPDLTLRALSARSRSIIECQVRELGLDKLARLASSMTDGRVASGPFKGMKLDYDALPVHGAPKFSGTYEKELHPIIERAILLSPRVVLNVGCAEGFYAVGLALRLPKARVYFADADAKAERATMRNATINGIGDRIEPIGIIKPTQFGRYLEPGSLLVMDCEGAEFSLLNPVTDPALQKANIIVEVHPEGGTLEEIASRFNRSHKLTVVLPTNRTTNDLPAALTGIPISAMDERTGKKSWLYMEATT